MSWLSEFLHPKRGFDAAQNQLNQYYNQAQQYADPFMNRGQQAGGDLSSMLAMLMNPEQLQSQWAEGYEESPYAKQLSEQATNQGMDAASSMGLLGSSAALGNIQQGASNIMNADRQQYMNDLMQKYMQAIGIGQNLYGTGANMASNMGQNAMNMGQNSAQLQFGRQNAGGNMLADILGKIGGTASTALGGRYARTGSLY